MLRRNLALRAALAAALTIALLAGQAPAIAAEDKPADLVLTNGAILPVDAQDRVAEAVAVRELTAEMTIVGGKIVRRRF